MDFEVCEVLKQNWMNEAKATAIEHPDQAKQVRMINANTVND